MRFLPKSRRTSGLVAILRKTLKEHIKRGCPILLDSLFVIVYSAKGFG